MKKTVIPFSYVDSVRSNSVKVSQWNHIDSIWSFYTFLEDGKKISASQ